MTDQEPTGESFDGTLFTSGSKAASADETYADDAEVISARVFIPAAWREELGFGQDD
jgi:hypothetical protein